MKVWLMDRTLICLTWDAQAFWFLIRNQVELLHTFELTVPGKSVKAQNVKSILSFTKTWICPQKVEPLSGKLIEERIFGSCQSTLKGSHFCEHIFAHFDPTVNIWRREFDIRSSLGWMYAISQTSNKCNWCGDNFYVRCQLRWNSVATFIQRWTDKALKCQRLSYIVQS